MKEIDYSNYPEWQRPAKAIDDFNACRVTIGREFMVRLSDGVDPVLALANFARKEHIRFARVHTACHGTTNPTNYHIWIYDYKEPEHWAIEGPAVSHNNTMLCSVSGMISTRPDGKGGEEPFAAIHVVNGGAWDSSTISGHLLEGSRVKGCWQVFVTELLDIEKLEPVSTMGPDYKYPGNWYQYTK